MSTDNNQKNLSRDERVLLAEELANKLDYSLEQIDGNLTSSEFEHNIIHSSFVYNFGFLLAAVLTDGKIDLFYKNIGENYSTNAYSSYNHFGVFKVFESIFSKDHNVWKFINLVKD